MRRFLALFFILFVISSSSFAQTKVDWKPEIIEALALAKAEGKLLFVEAYLPTCPACQAVEPIFNNTEVAQLYNTEFVNFKLDLSIDGKRKFLDDKKIYIPSFPQFLFFDGDGNLVHQGEVSPTASSLLEVGKSAANPLERSSSFASKFENGDREFSFLVRYGVFTRVMMDTLNNRKVVDALFEIIPEEEIGTETSWFVTKKVVSFTDNGFFKYWINNLSVAAAYEDKVGHKGQEMQTLGSIVQATLLSQALKYYSFEKLQEMRVYMQKIGAGQYADTYLWENEVMVKIREGKTEDALSIGNKMADNFKGNAPSMIYITKTFTDHFPNTSYIVEAYKWLSTAKSQLKESNYLAEYYYELARLDAKLGKMEEAKKNASEALKLATSAKVDTKKFNELLTRF